MNKIILNYALFLIALAAIGGLVKNVTGADIIPILSFIFLVILTVHLIASTYTRTTSKPMKAVLILAGINLTFSFSITTFNLTGPLIRIKEILMYILFGAIVIIMIQRLINKRKTKDSSPRNTPLEKDF